ncbi:MAG TPA: uroporphyrinogen decarboxylase family protein [Acidimicrobiales bacterium]|nr:uroporphyrinogen decarboxylase family protein [Acidimicrobiales bacterium]
MGTPTEQRYRERLDRYVTAMDVGKPDKVPIRLNLGEVAATFAGFTLEEIYYDREKNTAAATKVLTELDLDVTPGAPSLWWASLHDAVGARYLRWAGRELDVNTQFQFVEGEYMLADEYDAFIADPTRWILETYLPRIHADFAEPGSYRANLALVKGAWGLHSLLEGMGNDAASWASDYGMPSAFSGLGKAPFDTLGDTLRGMKGILLDLHRRPEKILAATDMLVPHNVYYALASAAGDTILPDLMPLHRGSLPFLNPKQWDTYYWPSLRRVLEGLWAQGKRTLFYAEGNWTPYLERIAELPERSIVFHVDQTDMSEAKRILGGRFCLSGGVPNTLLAYGTPSEVADHCKRLIDEYAADGGFIVDSCSVMQTDVQVANVVALVEAVREHGVY